MTKVRVLLGKEMRCNTTDYYGSQFMHESKPNKERHKMADFGRE
jgi:hypothetical protein